MNAGMTPLSLGHGQRFEHFRVIAGLVPAIHRKAYSVPRDKVHVHVAQLLGVHPREQAAGTLYIGVTNGIVFRVEQHRAGKGSVFTRKYKVHMLVWCQEYGDVREATQREKTMKEWPRVWKINLIERTNPYWEDLYPSLPGVKPVVL